MAQSLHSFWSYFLHSSPVVYWVPSDLGSSPFSIISFCLFILFLFFFCLQLQRSWSWMILWRPTRPSSTNTQKRCPFHHRRLECKVRSHKITGVTDKFGLEYKIKQGKGKQSCLAKREHTGHSKHALPTTQDSTCELHQMVNTEIRLIIFFAAKDGEALYS